MKYPSFNEVYPESFIQYLIDNDIFTVRGSSISDFIMIEDIADEFTWFDNENDHYSLLINSPEFYDLFVEYLKNAYKQSIHDLNNDIQQYSKNNHIFIKRAISIEKSKFHYYQNLQKTKEPIDIGRYFSTGYCQVYDVNIEDNCIEIIIECNVHIKCINFIETIRARCDYANGNLEDEIQLFNGTPIIIDNISFNEY